MTTRSDDQEVCPGGRLGEHFRWMPLRHLTGDPRPGLGWPPHCISMYTPGVVPKRLRVLSLAGGVPYDGKCHAVTTWTCLDRKRASSGAHSRGATDESDPSTLTTIRKNCFCHHDSSLYGNCDFIWKPCLRGTTCNAASSLPAGGCRNSKSSVCGKPHPGTWLQPNIVSRRTLLNCHGTATAVRFRHGL